MKQCTKCGEWKEENEYAKKGEYRHAECKVCHTRIEKERYYRKHDEIRIKVNTARSNWTEERKEYNKEWKKKYREKNRDKLAIKNHNKYIKRLPRIKETSKVYYNNNRIMFIAKAALNRWGVSDNTLLRLKMEHLTLMHEIKKLKGA